MPRFLRSAAAILAAKRPVIYAGGGILLANAATEMRELAEHLSLPRRWKRLPKAERLASCALVANAKRAACAYQD